MGLPKGMISGSMSLLLLSLLQEADMYGHQIIQTLRNRSNYTFDMKAGTLYPLLHSLEKQQAIVSSEKLADNGRLRIYYRITAYGTQLLAEKKDDWNTYTRAVRQVLEGGRACATA